MSKTFVYIFIHSSVFLVGSFFISAIIRNIKPGVATFVVRFCLLECYLRAVFVRLCCNLMVLLGGSCGNS